MQFSRSNSQFSSLGRQTSEVLEAARCGQAGDVEEAIHLGADISAGDLHGMTCLHHAAARGSLSIVDVLIRYNAPLNCTDDAGMAPLHSAVLHDRAGVVQVFFLNLKLGGDYSESCIALAATYSSWMRAGSDGFAWVYTTPSCSGIRAAFDR